MHSLECIHSPRTQGPSDTCHEEIRDVVSRLRLAVELRAPGSVGDILTRIVLPKDAPGDLSNDLLEFKMAAELNLKKMALPLSGSIAEALLLQRHPDKSERGPGLSKLLEEAKSKRLFGRDTLRQFETLNDYRDSIHTRAGPRNRIIVNNARVEHAAMALKLLCAELDDIEVRF